MTLEQDLATQVKAAMQAYSAKWLNDPRPYCLVPDEEKAAFARECGAPEHFIGLILLACNPSVYGYGAIDLWAEHEYY